MSGLQAAQLHCQARADERNQTHQDLADLTGYSQALITVALTPGGPIPVKVLAAIANAVDCRLELRDPLTIEDVNRRRKLSDQPASGDAWEEALGWCGRAEQGSYKQAAACSTISTRRERSRRAGSGARWISGSSS